jgi:uncharacterized protein (DUF305 family)
MSPSRRAMILGGTAAAAAAPAQAQTPASQAHGHPEGARQTSFATEMHERMRSMAETMYQAPMTGNPDRDFLAMMIPHHQGAIDMAHLVLVHGQDPLTRQLAEEIIASQQAEIASMRARLKELERGQTPDPDGFPALTGTRGKGFR